MLIASNVAEVLADLAEQLAYDPDFTDAQRAALLAKARPMAERITRANLYRMRARVQH